MRIDAHQHFWKYNSKEYPWIGEDRIRRDFLPPELAAEQAKVHFDGSVAVEARASIEESRWLLELAEANPKVYGVVGWVDLLSPDVETQLARFAPNPKFAGVRYGLQGEEDDRFALRPAFLNGISKLSKFGLAFDLLIVPKQLPAAIELVKQFPRQPFVVDHMAKPLIKAGTIEPWAGHMRELAAMPNVSCKVSGLVTEADWRHWRPEDFVPYLDVVAGAFGEDRLMIGSDWPVCLIAASYEQVTSLATSYLEKRFSPAALRKISGENAVRFYKLKP